MKNVKKKDRHKVSSSQKKGKKKNGENEGKFAGFTTLSQVTGAPKRHSFHSRIQPKQSAVIKEPCEKCALCSQTIQSIAEAVSLPDGRHVHFDCALEDIRKQHKIHEGQILSYVGKGAFGICEKNEEGKWIIIERIQYESAEDNQKFREYVEEHKVE